MEIKLETKRLILREIVPADLDGLFELDSNANVHKYLGNKPVQNKEEIKLVIQNLRQQYIDNGIARWAVIDKITNEFYGWSGIKFITNTMNNHTNFYELGYRIIEQHWGKGFATETTIALVSYAFENLQTDSLYAICDIENMGSKNVLQKTGFTLIETFNHEGIVHNWFKITKSEWLLNKTLS